MNGSILWIGSVVIVAMTAFGTGSDSVKVTGKSEIDMAAKHYREHHDCFSCETVVKASVLQGYGVDTLRSLLGPAYELTRAGTNLVFPWVRDDSEKDATAASMHGRFIGYWGVGRMGYSDSGQEGDMFSNLCVAGIAEVRATTDESMGYNVFSNLCVVYIRESGVVGELIVLPQCRKRWIPVDGNPVWLFARQRYYGLISVSTRPPSPWSLAVETNHHAVVQVGDKWYDFIIPGEKMAELKKVTQEEEFLEFLDNYGVDIGDGGDQTLMVAIGGKQKVVNITVSVSQERDPAYRAKLLEIRKGMLKVWSLLRGIVDEAEGIDSRAVGVKP